MCNQVHMHGTTKSKAILTLLVFMYFADISIVNSGVCEAYAHVYHLVYILWNTKQCTIKLGYSHISTFITYASMLVLKW